MRVALKKAPVQTIMGRPERALLSGGHVLGLLLLANLMALPAVCAQSLNTPLPQALQVTSTTRSTSDYHSLPVSLHLRQAKEALVPISKFKIAGESYYKRDYKTADREPRVRLSVAQKLQIANDQLKAHGLELYVLDGYRPLALQEELWQHFLHKAKVSSAKKDLKSLKEHAAKYCSNPETFKLSDSHTWPSHITGGAVDLTLRHIGGRLADMGGDFDADSKVSHTAYYETAKSTDKASLTARHNRRLLYNAMHAQGFENYPYEWWHYDYGNQSWSMDSDQHKTAFYGPAKDK